MRLVLSSCALLTLVLVGCAPTASPSKTGSSVAGAPTGPGALTPANTRIEWLGAKKDGQHKGSFESFSGAISPIDKPFDQTKVTVDIEVGSLKSDDPKLTKHLLTPDFFHAEKYPRAVFVSTSIKPEKKDDFTHAITGDLTLHGTTRSITFPAKVKETDDQLTLDGKVTIDRTEFGMTFDPAKVNKEVVIEISAKVARK